MNILKSAHPWRLALLMGLLIVMALWLSALAADPAGAGHKPTHNPGGGSDKSATVEMSGGMVTFPDPDDEGKARPQDVTLEENNNRIRIQGLTDDHKQWTIKVEINLTETQRTCIGDPSLISKLVDPSTDRFFLMQVDKNSLGIPSGGQKGHRFSLHWHELSPSKELEELDLRFDTPTVTGPADGKRRVFKFTEGRVKVRKNYSTTLECDNMDIITVTITGFE